MLLSDGKAVEKTGDGRLDSEANVLNRLGILVRGEGADRVRLELLGKYKGGKRMGDKNIPVETKRDIKDAADTGVLTQEEIAEITRISQASVSNISRGLNGRIIDDRLSDDPSGREMKVESIKDKILDIVLEKISAAVGMISEDKLAGSKAVDLSVVARNLSSVNDKLLSRAKAVGDGVKVIIFAPTIKAEGEYERIRTINPNADLAMGR